MLYIRFFGNWLIFCYEMNISISIGDTRYECIFIKQGSQKNCHFDQNLILKFFDVVNFVFEFYSKDNMTNMTNIIDKRLILQRNI